MGRGRHLLGVVTVALALALAGCLPVTATDDPAPPPPTTPPFSTLLPPGAPNPYTAGKGEFIAQCPFDHRATEDPIVAPGNAAFWHTHDFFGNTTTGKDSTAATLLGQATTCWPGDDAAAYWVPTLYANGGPVTPTLVNFYYRVLPPQDPTKVEPFPAGLKMIAGKAMAKSPQPDSVVHWSCVGRTGTSATIPSCGGSALQLTLNFPECWDGVHLDTADHTSHMVYANGASCPADHPKLLPQLVYEIQYPVSGPGVAVASDSMNGANPGPSGQTAHGDFINVWNQGVLGELVEVCLNTPIICTNGSKP